MKVKSPYPKSVYYKNAEIYSILSNPIRLEILNTIKNKEVTVEDLTKMLKLRKPNVSQHLALLRQARLVKVRRAGQYKYYKISDPRIVEPCRIMRDLWKSKRY